MRMRPGIAALVFGFSTAVPLGAAIFLAPTLLAAEEHATPAASLHCPAVPPATTAQPIPAPAVRPPVLGDSERIAALEALQLALSEVGDGATYIWHARSGLISGAVSPTQSFAENSGRICRHIVVALSAGNATRRTEGIACRLASGIWQLDG